MKFLSNFILCRIVADECGNFAKKKKHADRTSKKKMPAMWTCVHQRSWWRHLYAFPEMPVVRLAFHNKIKKDNLILRQIH